MQINGCLWPVIAALVTLSTATIYRPPYVGSLYPHGHGPFGPPRTTPAPHKPSDCWGVDTTVNAIRRFGDDIYAALTWKKNKGNIIISPFSLTMALSMAWVGADGQTDVQLGGALRYMWPLYGDCKYREGHQKLLNSLSTKESHLSVVNQAFVGRRFRLLRKYKDIVRKYYHASTISLPFRRYPEFSRRYINRWVKRRTGGNIANLLPRRSVSRDTVLTLVNALTFQARWKYPFARGLTKKVRFYHSTKRYVNMMTSYGGNYLRYAYVSAIDSQVIELPFYGSNVAMYVLLPQGNRDLEFIEQRRFVWNPKGLNLKYHKVEVKLPKFRMRSQLALKKPLHELWTRLPFDRRRASFLHFTGRRGAWIHDMFHYTYINMHEQGTDASVATAPVFRYTNRPTRATAIQFVANRPFVFYLCDRQTNALLFMGRFNG